VQLVQHLSTTLYAPGEAGTSQMKAIGPMSQALGYALWVLSERAAVELAVHVDVIREGAPVLIALVGIIPSARHFLFAHEVCWGFCKACSSRLAAQALLDAGATPMLLRLTEDLAKQLEASEQLRFAKREAG
jgi:hypothetical protein